VSATVSFARPDGKEASGYLAEPKFEGAPGIVLLGEWWGLNTEIKALADRFAASGFRMLAPDIYEGRVTDDREEAGHMMSSLDFVDAATQYARGAALFLKQGGGKVGVMGLCAGGALALLCAMHVSEFDAAAVFYGIPPEDAGDPGLIKIPLIAHWADRDEFFTTAAVNALEDRLKAGRVAYEFFRYDAEHAFVNPKGLGHYDKDCAESAIHRTEAFFTRALR
jgi:carboxymethylenebutenolidase